MSHVSHANGLWFLNNHAAVEIAQDSNADRISVIRLKMPFGEAPPLHIHHGEDEIFHVVSGEIRYRIGDATVVKRTGETVLAPRGIPHGFRVLSPDGAEALVITRGGFEAMVRSVARPAAIAGLPATLSPSVDMQVQLAHQCQLRDIEILGPPIA